MKEKLCSFTERVIEERGLLPLMHTHGTERVIEHEGRTWLFAIGDGGVHCFNVCLEDEAAPEYEDAVKVLVHVCTAIAMQHGKEPADELCMAICHVGIKCHEVRMVAHNEKYGMVRVNSIEKEA